MKTLGDIMDRIDEQNTVSDAQKREALNRARWEFLHGYITCPAIDQFGHKWISTTAETWRGKVKVDLDKDGNCHIRITDKCNNRITTLLDANLDDIVTNQTQFKVIPLAKIATGFVPNYK